jgi:hypothetical protein
MKNSATKTAVLIALFAFLCLPSWAQQSLHAFFAGNSYTSVNDLPRMVADIAQNMGDEMIYASNTPGGCTFEMHCSNTTMDRICQGGWDYVILQEQSQLPAFPIEMVEAMVYPYAAQLVDSVHAFNTDGEALFFMTWGRKNGDTEYGPMYPMMSTYEGMDSLLYERYRYMAETNDAPVCPVGRVWHYLRDNHSQIELYMSDESHPSLAGSYAAACAFYTMMFGRDPDSITYDAGVGMKTASIIRSAVHKVVYDSLWVWQGIEPFSLPYKSQSSELEVSPNPTSGQINIEAKNATTIKVFDLYGCCVAQHPLKPGQNTICLGHLAEGLYFIKEERTGMARKLLIKK